MRSWSVVAAVGLAVVAGAAGYAVLTGDAPGAGAPPAGPPMVAVDLPELSPVAEAGRAAFAETCAACHGPNAGGREGLGPPLIHPYYEPNHHGDMAFWMAAQRGVRAHHWRFGDMPPVPEASEHDIAAIIAYVREVQRANGIF